MNKELLLSAQINFENLEKMMPEVKFHPLYKISKFQLDEGLKEDGEPEGELK